MGNEELILNSQFSTLNSQFSTFNSQLSIFNSQLSILNSQFSTLRSGVCIFDPKTNILHHIQDTTKYLKCKYIFPAFLLFYER